MAWACGLGGQEGCSQEDAGAPRTVPPGPSRLSAAPALLPRAPSAPGAAWVPEAVGPGPEQSLGQRDPVQGRELGSWAESLGSWCSPRRGGSSFSGG